MTNPWARVPDGESIYSDCDDEPPVTPVALVAPLVTRTSGADLLNDVQAFLSRFVAFPSEAARVAVTLWAAHTHAMDCWESTPRLALLSPEPGSGKTRTQEILELLVPRPLLAVNASAAAVFRLVSDPDGRPTILLDECDSIFGPRSGGDNEELRGLVDSGHRRSGTTARCVISGRTITVERFPSYCAVSLSGLDDLPDTLMARSVVVRMRRRAPSEKVTPYRHRLFGPEGYSLGDRLAAWTKSVSPMLTDAIPDMPDGIEDRAADVWEALLTIADAAGGDWPERARCSAVALVAPLGTRTGTPTVGVLLLSDLRDVFGDADKLSTAMILDALTSKDESPWGDLRGRPLDARGLAKRLSKYEISSKNIRTDEGIIKGYTAADLFDAWGRYLPPAPVRVTSNATSATALQPCARCGEPLAEMDLLAKATTHHDCQMAARR
jgi:Protein of unknown function (DUF3631)